MTSALAKLSKEDLIDRMDVLQEVAVKLLSGESRESVMTFLMQKAMELCPCDGGTLYLLNTDNDKLNFEVMINSTFPNQSFHSFAIPLKVKSIATYSFVNKLPLVIDDVYILDPEMGVKFNDSMDSKVEYRTKSMITMPISKSDGSVIGLIQLINRKNFFKEAWVKDRAGLSEMPGFSKADKETLSRLTTLATASLENWYYPTDGLRDFKEEEDFLL